MKSIRSIYKIGRGPSSSHTMGPEKAARDFQAAWPQAASFRVVLYGSLAETGRGHGTDIVIQKTFAPRACEIVFNKAVTELPHPNTMDLFALDADGDTLGSSRVLSIGGGELAKPGERAEAAEEIYPLSTFAEISEHCKRHRMRICEYVVQMEGPEILDYLHLVWKQMCQSIEEGLTHRGALPGSLHLERKAQYLYEQRHIDERAETRENRLVCAYAFAVSEENASGGVIVTAPTCGSCGVLPAVLKYMQEEKGYNERAILNALATAGLIGNLIRTNSSISGAECGCQAEIGSACSMASAALAELFELGIDQVEYAAEVAMEHHLGLTCDPIDGLVQIPCIERNAVAAMRSINAVRISNFLTGLRKISFDTVVKTMYQTGKDMHRAYRETSEGGLAKTYR